MISSGLGDDFGDDLGDVLCVDSDAFEAASDAVWI